MGANVPLATNSRKPLLFMGNFIDVPVAQTSVVLCGPLGSEIGALDFKRSYEGVRCGFSISPRQSTPLVDI
jgi:hypothetical protein